MTKLSGFLSDDQRRSFALESLVPGRVLFLQVEFTTPPKSKYVVFLCRGPRPLLFLINSRIPALSQTTPELRACQIKLNASDYHFLHHDSFLDCSELIDAMHESEIIDQLIADPSRVRGALEAEEKRQLVGIIHCARTLSKYHKDKIIAAFSV